MEPKYCIEITDLIQVEFWHRPRSPHPLYPLLLGLLRLLGVEGVHVAQQVHRRLLGGQGLVPVKEQ